MKSFLNFLTEAKESQAAMQAKKLGLYWRWSRRVDWIVPVKLLQELKRENLSSLKKEHQKDKKNQKQILKNLLLLQTKPKTKAAQAPAPESKAPKKPAPEDQSQETPPLTIVFGRFNPPTVGHDKLLKSARRISAGGDVKIYPSRTQDPKKNPLDPDMKISFMKKMFPDFKEIIINDDNMRSIFDVLINANEEGYSSVNIVVGSDRQAEFENLAQKYNGDLYNFDLIRVVSAGVRDADAEGVEGMSASKMRKAVLDDDFKSFRKGTPKTLDDADTQSLFNAVRQGMGAKKKKKEVVELWQIAPKYDQQTLRENYLTGKIFRIGDIVENLNTGLVGEDYS
jgi:hypothetical protein